MYKRQSFITAAAPGRSYTRRYGRNENENQNSSNTNICLVPAQQQLWAHRYGVAARRTFSGQSPSRAHDTRPSNARTSPLRVIPSPRDIFHHIVYVSTTCHTKYTGPVVLGNAWPIRIALLRLKKVRYIKRLYPTRNDSSTRRIR